MMMMRFNRTRRAVVSSAIQVRSFGALTSTPYAFTARPWELRRTDTVDCLDGMGSSIQIHSRGGEVLRVNPRMNDSINEDWINDKTRFAFDGLKRQRLTRPLVRSSTEPNKWDEMSSNWRAAFGRIAQVLKVKKNIRAVIGPTVDLYSAVAMTDLMSKLGVQVESLGSVGGTNGADISSQYRFNTSLLGLEQSDYVLIVGTNLSVESPLLQTRLRKMFLDGQAEMATVGCPSHLTFPVQTAGTTAGTLIEIAEGRHPICAKLANAKKPSIIVGANVFEREDGHTLAAALETIGQFCGNMRQYNDKGEVSWNGINVLHHNANDAGLLELGRTIPLQKDRTPEDEVLFLLGVYKDDLPFPIDNLVGKKTFTVFQGHHGDELTSRSDVVLPGAAFSEKSGVYVNFEGRMQKGINAVTAPADGREDWKVIRALSEVLGDALPYDNEAAIHARLSALLPAATHRNHLPKLSGPEKLLGGNYVNLASKVLGKGVVNNTPFKPALYDFYLDGTPISRSSQTMAKCSSQMLDRSNFKTQNY